MDARDVFLLASTALVGLVCGVYIYVMIFVPVYVDDQPDNFSSEQFEIIGEMYGDCPAGCASFRLTSDRSFQYLANPQVEPTEGTYPRRTFGELRSFLEAQDLSSPAEPVPEELTVRCASANGGIDYSYTITIDAATFSLDTCRSQLPGGSALDVNLRTIFRAVADPEGA